MFNVTFSGRETLLTEPAIKKAESAIHKFRPDSELIPKEALKEVVKKDPAAEAYRALYAPYTQPAEKPIEHGITPQNIF